MTKLIALVAFIGAILSAGLAFVAALLAWGFWPGLCLLCVMAFAYCLAWLSCSYLASEI